MRLSVIPQLVLAASLVLPAISHAQTDVTTTGGTNDYVPVFTGGSTVVNSIIQQYNGGIGIGTTPAANFDVKGYSIFRGSMILSRSGNASSSGGYPSYAQQFQSSVYNSSTKSNSQPYFEFQSEPIGNNTASPGATLNFLYYPGTGASPAETGLYINPNGTIHFAAGQTFTAGVAAPALITAQRGEPGLPGPVGPQGPAGPSGIAGPDIAVPGTVAASRGFLSESNDASTSQFIGSNSADNAVVASLSATGNHSYALKTSGDVGISAQGSYLAGQFVGDVAVTGNIASSGSSYRIDDPLDPENKTLTHSSVSSPDMMNIYNGSVVTDSTGVAVVTMPSYFEALNRDFRYQLTVVGGEFAQAIVGSEVAGGIFTIRTDKPNVAVSWQVTGIRQDAWANAHRLVVEEDKTR